VLQRMSKEEKPLKRTFSNKLFGKKDEKTGEARESSVEDEKVLKRTFSNKKFGKKDESTGQDHVEEKKLARTLSISKLGRKSQDGSDVEEEKKDEKVLKRTFSNKLFGKKDEKTGQDVEEKTLARTLSISKLGRKSQDGSDVEEEKKDEKVLKRTFSNKLFGKKDEKTGQDVSSTGGGDGEKPVLRRTFSQKFQKEEKKKLKARFDIRVVRVSKCQINNTTVFLGWSRTATSVGGDTKRAVVTDCCATFGDTISVEAVLSLPTGSEKFNPALINFELKVFISVASLCVVIKKYVFRRTSWCAKERGRPSGMCWVVGSLIWPTTQKRPSHCASFRS
jgi:hypothetical protein